MKKCSKDDDLSFFQFKTKRSYLNPEIIIAAVQEDPYRRTLRRVRTPVHLTIPDKDTQGNEVTEIGENAFSGNEYIQEVIIPSTIKIIGAGAFENCVNLKNIIGGEKVLSIGHNAFRGCIRLTEFDEHMRSGDDCEKDAFAGCYSLEQPV